MKTTKNVKANTTAKKSTGAKTETTKKSTASKSTTATKTSGVKGMLTTLKSLLDSGKITDKKLKVEVQNSLKVKNPTVEAVSELLKRVVDSGKPVAENEVKKPLKKTATKTEEKKTETTKKTVTKAKSSTKTEPKKTEESAVKSIQSTGNKKPPTAILFPETLNLEVEGEKSKFRRAKDDEFTSLKEIYEAIADEENPKKIVFAGYWTARHIKEYNYAGLFDVAKTPKKFDNDLDIALAITISEMNGKLFAMSIYTEAMYVFLEEDFEPIEDKNPYTGEKFTVRVSNGMEFAVYVAD